jgi:hypothetical protein
MFELPSTALEEKVLDAFKTTNGWCLFPLNRSALARLIREACQNGNPTPTIRALSYKGPCSKR